MGKSENKNSLTLAMIVKDEADRLPNLWASVKHIVDEWIVVDTGSKDGTVEVAKKLGAKVYEEGARFTTSLSGEHVEFFAKHGVKARLGDPIFDFAKARNYSFSKATKDFILWLDADDLLVGSDKLKTIINLNLEKGQNKGLHLLYKYEVDEFQNSIVEHWRERVVPNNGKYQWKGMIHEIIIPEEETKYVQVKERDSHVLHTSTDRTRKTSGERNIRALLLELYNQGEDPDPRTLFELGESFNVGYGEQEKALEFYKSYLELSGWDEERALACQRICDIYLRLGDKAKALDYAYQGIKERPDFPGAYANVSQCYYSLDDFSNAIMFAEQSLGLEQPKTNTFINQKHVRFTPLIILASCYFKLGQIDKAIIVAEDGLKIEPTNKYLVNIVQSSKRQQCEEKISEYFKHIHDYLTNEGELSKATELWNALPWSHEDDPRMNGLAHESVNKLMGSLEEAREFDTSITLKNIEEKLPYITFLHKELSNRGAKSIFLVGSENDDVVQEYLSSKGYDVSRVVGDSDKFDAVVAFSILERLHSPENLLKFFVKYVRRDGLCVITTQLAGEPTIPTQVRVWTTNAVGNLLENNNLGIVNSIPVGDKLYTSFLPGHYQTKRSFAFVCGESVEEWGPLSIHSGIGGSEEATIYLSQELARLGHSVTVFNNCPTQCTYEGVKWRHHATLKPTDHFDTAILWRIPHQMEHYGVKADHIALWLHDVPEHFWFTKDRLERIDTYIVLSEYHKSLLPSQVPEDRIWVSSNGVQVEQFSELTKRDPHKVIYTSSYDRGLEHLLTIWPDVLKEVPKATLEVYYGWGSYDKMRKRATQRAWKSRMMEMLKQPGVKDNGRIGQAELAKEMMGASIFAYPCHFEEISCISAMKSQLAGCVPLTTDYAALAETNLCKDSMVSGDVKEPEVLERYKRALIETLKNPPSDKERKNHIINPALKTFSWKNVARKWSDKLITKQGENNE